MHKWVIFVTIAFATFLVAQSDLNPLGSLDILKSKFLPAEFAGMNFTANDAKKILRERCRKVSGDNETIFNQAHRGALEFVTCISGLGDLSAIQQEIEIAKPIGELDTIFHKYCKKQHQLESCFNNLMPKIKPCLNEEERARNDLMTRVATKMLGFMCHKGGDQIALFFAEQGPECLEENKDNINNCLNESFASYIPKNGLPDLNSKPQLVMGKKECADMEDFEKCLLFHLSKCEDITPSNIIESVFKYVKNETQCIPKPEKLSSGRSAGSTAQTSFELFMGILFLFILRKFVIS